VILALRALGIGDLCTAVPALRALRATHPCEEISLAAPRWLAPLVALTECLDRVVPVEDLEPRRWSVDPPRLGVNLHGCGPQSHRLLASARPRRMWAFASPAAGFADGPPWRDDEHEAARWCRLLWWYGVPADPADLRLPRYPLPVAVSGVPVHATVVHPGAKAAERRWPATRFASVAAALSDAGHRVVVTGSAAEAPLVQAVAREAGLPEGAVLAGGVDVAGLAALVAHARLVVCGDTGIGHLATAYGTPSVLLFGPTSPARWGPSPDRPAHRVLWHGPGGHVAAITVPEVLAAANDVMRVDAAAAQ
jgi:ADP-heptose:LPS heptosyltransferase